MQKKIAVSDLKTGMYIVKLDGNWLKHPFWKTSFKLETEKDLKTLQHSEVSHVWIDTEKGDDISPVQVQVSEPSAPESAPEPAPRPVQSNFEDEVDTAKQTIERAREATIEMFNDARMGRAVSPSDVAPLVEDISNSVIRNPAAMISLTRMKSMDEYTYLHSVAVCALMISLGLQIDYKGELEALGTAGLLHDIGKMTVPEEILNKPGRLTDEEFEIMKGHTTGGWEMLRSAFDANDITLDVCLHHHERIDGRGYPEQLGEEKISQVARMGAVCDVYDAITSTRCYKQPWEPAEAIRKMAEWKTGQFDEDIFNAFVKTVGIYPTGTLVKLKSGRLAIVADQSGSTLLKPRVKVFYSGSSHSPIPQKMVELSKSQEQIERIENPADWGFTQQRIMEILIS